MSEEFWLGVLATVIVGIPGTYLVGLLVNLHTPRLVKFIDKRKLLKKHKTRQQALTVFNRIRSFHDGVRDRYAYFIITAVVSVLFGLFAATFFTVFFIRVRDIPFSVDDAFFILLGTFGALFALIPLVGIYETARQLERFDDYKAEFEKRWGPIDGKPPKS